MVVPTPQTRRAVAPQEDWEKELAKYEKPDARQASLELIKTLVPYLSLMFFMFWMVHTGISYWLVFPLILLAAGFLVRTFIIFHDCVHGSFFASKQANLFWGYICGFLAFTDYLGWKIAHLLHHSTSSDLDFRGDGDIWTMTRKEYVDAPKHIRIIYRVFRNPFFLFFIGAPFLFFIIQRFPKAKSKNRRIVPKQRMKEVQSVLALDVGIMLILVLAHYTIGLKAYALVQIPVMTIAAAMGVWLFYVQHQFEFDYWERHGKWTPTDAALKGSTFYDLPWWLAWLTGYIGYHPHHHLRMKIPFYNLVKVHKEVKGLREAVIPLRFMESLPFAWLAVWDEEGVLVEDPVTGDLRLVKRMLTFKEVHQRLGKL